MKIQQVIKNLTMRKLDKSEVDIANIKADIMI